MKDEADKYAYQGAAYLFVGFDELTHFTDTIYDYIGFSRQRRRVGVNVPVRTRATANPGGIGHVWVKKRFIDERADGVTLVPAKVADNPGLDEADYAASLGHLPEQLRKQLMDGDWGAFEAQAFPDFGETHLIDRFEHAPFERFEAMDFGLSNPTCWALWATDYDGNLIVCDTHYAPGLPSDTAEIVLGKRKAGWGVGNTAVADPSIWHRTGGLNRWGQPATIATEFLEAGVHLIPGNNDPRAGYARLRELIKLDPGHEFPAWHPRAGEKGSPRLFVVAERCTELVEQLRMAPLQPIDKADAGEKIDPEWEGRHGHGTAMSRYAVLSKPRASTEPEDEEIDGRAWMQRGLLESCEQRLDEGDPGGRYVWV